MTQPRGQTMPCSHFKHRIVGAGILSLLVNPFHLKNHYSADLPQPLSCSPSKYLDLSSLSIRLDLHSEILSNTKIYALFNLRIILMSSPWNIIFSSRKFCKTMLY